MNGDNSESQTNYRNGNTASVEGDGSYASAGGLFGSIWSRGYRYHPRELQRSIVKGDNSSATAGALATGANTSAPGTHNTASAKGNSSSATAGPGKGNEVFVVGDNQHVPPQP